MARDSGGDLMIKVRRNQVGAWAIMWGNWLDRRLSTVFGTKIGQKGNVDDT